MSHKKRKRSTYHCSDYGLRRTVAWRGSFGNFGFKSKSRNVGTRAYEEFRAQSVARVHK